MTGCELGRDSNTGNFQLCSILTVMADPYDVDGISEKTDSITTILTVMAYPYDADGKSQRTKSITKLHTPTEERREQE